MSAQLHLPSQMRNRLHAFRDLYALGPDRLASALIEWLDLDQTKTGLHAGEFGHHADLVIEEGYQASRAEDMNVKPRMYHTGWPCFVLMKHRIWMPCLDLTQSAIITLLKRGAVYVRQSAKRGMSPDSCLVEIISFRHTIRAAQIVHTLKGDPGLVRLVLGRMIDDGWQCEDGGWSQTEEHRQSDLWASAYAAQFLHSVLRDESVILDSSASDAIDKLLSTSLAFLATRWNTDHWKYESYSSEHNGTELLLDVAQSLSTSSPDLMNDILSWMAGWTNSTVRSIRDDFFLSAPKVTRAQAHARFAYAFFLVNSPIAKWRPLFEMALTFAESGLASADIAFLLDMCLALCSDPAVKSIRSLACATPAKSRPCIYIGHGRSEQWHILRDYLVNNLKLDYDEFDRISAVGQTVHDRLVAMLDRCPFAFLVLTAEDEMADGGIRARENVVHELGLWAGRYGFDRALIVLEEGCSQFSNIEGRIQIRFAHGRMKDALPKVKAVLLREGLIQEDSGITG